MEVSDKTNLMLAERHSSKFEEMLKHLSSLKINSGVIIGSFISCNSISSMSAMIEDISKLTPSQLSCTFDGCYEVRLISAGAIKYKLEL